MIAPKSSLPPSFWAKVEVVGECWLWTAAKTSRGYGSFGLGGKSHQVHRLTYADANGPIPDGLTIDHLRENGPCTSKLCVRPSHLEAVTRGENSQRYSRSITTCPVGHPLTFKPGDRQRRCRPCETDGKARRAAARELAGASA